MASAFTCALVFAFATPASAGPLQKPAAQGACGIGSTLYVNAAVAVRGNMLDGAGWATAFAYLQDALARAAACPEVQEVWVAGGVYYPDEGAGAVAGDRAATFEIPRGLRLYGGFAATETLRTERDWTAHPAVLSGDIDGNDFDPDGDGIAANTTELQGANAYHVLSLDGTAKPLTAATVLDGFTITGGMATTHGGGLYCNGAAAGGECSLTIANTTFAGNYAADRGGAVYNDGGAGGVSSPTFTNVIFRGNRAVSMGGAVANVANGGTSSPVFVNALFYGNTADYGGALLNDGNHGHVNPQVINATFSRNAAKRRGGALYNFGVDGESNPLLANTILWNNMAPVAHELYNYYSSPILHTTLLDDSAGNMESSDGLPVQDGVFSAEPAFADPERGDFRLLPHSGAIDAGDNAMLPAGVAVDLSGGVRYYDAPQTVDRGRGAAPLADVGAYEWSPCGGGITFVFVDRRAGGAANGSSWRDAFPTLQDALHSLACPEVQEVWVAGGVYYPDEGAGAVAGDRAATFAIPPGLRLYGGFAATETLRTERDWTAHPAVLSGDIDGNDFDPDGDGIAANTTELQGANAYHVLSLDGTAKPLTAATVLDGFTITGGMADSQDPVHARGGGLLCVANGRGSQCSPSLASLTFRGNRAVYGGALYAGSTARGVSSPSLANAGFWGNDAWQGGAVYAGSVGGAAYPSFVNVLFAANTAEDGAAFYNDGAQAVTVQPSLVNATFYGNMARARGGALFNVGAAGSTAVSMANTIIWGNTAQTAGAAFYNAATVALHHSLVQGGMAGSDVYNDNAILDDRGGNISADPLFVNAAAGDLRLSRFSPAVDAGDNTALPPGVTLDLAWQPRMQDNRAMPNTGSGGYPIVDLGAYEYMVICPSKGILHVDKRALAQAQHGDGASWGQALPYLQDGLGLAYDCPNVDQIWVAQGIYYPNETLANNVSLLSFEIPAGIGVYGGFAATETLLAQRDWRAHPTVLSGDLGRDDTVDAMGVLTSTAGINGDNAYVVVSFSWQDSVTPATRIDGFTVTGGDGTEGGGISCILYGSGECSPTLAHLVVRGNRAFEGGGMYILAAFGATSSPLLQDVWFLDNTAQSGGALYNLAFWGGVSSPQVVGAVFAGNKATTVGGAVCNQIYDDDSNPFFRSTVFLANVAGESGGAVYDECDEAQCQSAYTNVTFYGNRAGRGGAYAGYGSSTGHLASLFANTIFWGNQASTGSQAFNTDATMTLHHSLVEGGWNGQGVASDPDAVTDGGGNLALPPQFVDPVAGDLRLLSGSPALDAGDNASLTALLPAGAPADLHTADVRNLPRVVNGAVDLGAYEFQGLTITAADGSAQTAAVGSAFAQPLVLTLGSPFEMLLPGTPITLTPPAAGPGLDAAAPFSVPVDAGGLATVTLTANGLAGSYAVTATAAQVLTPATVTLTNAPLTLAVATGGSGQGAVGVSPPPFACSAPCRGGYHLNTTVTLTATPAVGSTFAGWSGDVDAAAAMADSLALTMTAPRFVTATFQLRRYTVVVSAEPAAGGSVAGGGEFDHGQAITATATANAGYRFVHWAEQAAPDTPVAAGSTYTFAAGGSRNLVARFAPLPRPAGDSATAESGGTITIPVLANDLDATGAPGSSLTVVAVGAPAHGTAAITPDARAVTYTPAPGYTGPDTFTYTVADGLGGTADGFVSIVVNAPALPPPFLDHLYLPALGR